MENSLELYKVTIDYNSDKKGTFNLITKDMSTVKKFAAKVYANLVDIPVKRVKVNSLSYELIDLDMKEELNKIYEGENLDRDRVLTKDKSMLVYVLK